MGRGRGVAVLVAALLVSAMSGAYIGGQAVESARPGVVEQAPALEAGHYVFSASTPLVEALAREAVVRNVSLLGELERVRVLSEGPAFGGSVVGGGAGSFGALRFDLHRASTNPEPPEPAWRQRRTRDT